VRHVALKVVSSKVVKYEKMCCHNEHDVIPFAFDIFDFLAVEVGSLIQKIMHSNVLSPMFMIVVFNKD